MESLKNLQDQEVIRMDKFEPRDYQREFMHAMESGGYKKAIVVWPRRCLHEETLVLLSNGKPKAIKDVLIGDRILSFDGKEIVEDIVEQVWKTGTKKVFNLKAFGGATIATSPDHKFFNGKRWIKASKTESVMQYMGCKSEVNNPDVAELLGLISNRFWMEDDRVYFSSPSVDVLYRTRILVEKLLDCRTVVTTVEANNFTTPTLVFSMPHNHSMSYLFWNRLSDEGIHREIFDMDKESVLRFVGGVISSSGNIYISEPVEDFQGSVEIRITGGNNDRFISDVYWLLRKISVFPQVPKGCNIRVTGNRHVREILNRVVIYGNRTKRSDALKVIADRCPLPSIKFGLRIGPLKRSQLYQANTYDIQTKCNHNFFANGYLVHNSGKDICSWNYLVRQAVREVGTYIYCLPKFSMCRRVLLDSKLHDGSAFMDFIPRKLIGAFNKTEMKISLVNGSIITMVGSDDAAQRIVGMSAKGIVISEAALSSPLGISYLQPIVTASNGFFICISTPRGMNKFHELYMTAKRRKDWFVSKLTVDETKHVPLERIQADIESGVISYELAQQEWWTSFSAINQGAYYAKYVDKMRLNDQLTTVNYEPSLPTLCFMDLGMNDMFVLLFAQFTPLNIRIIDYYENHSEGLEHYVNVIRNKDYGWVEVFAPHDIKVRELNTGMSRKDKLIALGLSVHDVPRMSINDGIEAVRTVLPRIYIDSKKCEKLIKAIENYSRDYDETTQLYKDKPNHNKWSHACDALRYLAVSSKLLGDIRGDSRELDERYQRVVHGRTALPLPFR